MGAVVDQTADMDQTVGAVMDQTADVDQTVGGAMDQTTGETLRKHPPPEKNAL